MELEAGNVSTMTPGKMVRAAALLGSARPGHTPAGTITRGRLCRIAIRKLPDPNTTAVETPTRIVVGTARSMGVRVAA